MAAVAAILPGIVHMYSKCFEGISGGLIQYFKTLPVLFMLGGLDDKTEEATPKKLQDARKKGQVPKSTDLNSAFILIALTLLLILLGDYYYTNGRLFVIEGLGLITGFGTINTESVLVIFKFALKNAVLGAAPITLTSMVIGIFSNVVQTGFLLTGEGLKLKLEKLNPIQGFKRFFSKRTFVEFLKTLIKLAIIGYGGYTYVESRLTQILTTSDLNAAGVYPFAKSLTDSFLIKMCGLMFLIGAADYIFQRRQYTKDMRMTKQEVKEEFRQMEGNPEIKSKQRQKQKQLASKRMLRQVPTATVVITNPTHLAIAIRYDKKVSNAPIVVAKGADMTAQRIKDIAKENKVPIVENKPVARMLFSKVEIDEAIPVELYQAVAEIIAYVYTLKK
jgi:flagellar biosynthetic protein FliR/FlhB